MGLAVFAVAPVPPVALLRLAEPPVTAFMLQRGFQAWLEGERDFALRRQPLPLEAMGPHLPRAVVAAEDQRFFQHHGFDLGSIRRALEEGASGGRLRGASTLTQQLARNLFLWPGRSWLRKGLEAWLTLWLELLLPKARILELYLNAAEFGDGVYGAGAASHVYFGGAPAALGPEQAARLAAVLPAPRRLRVAKPGPFVRARQAWIVGQMERLGRLPGEPHRASPGSRP